MKQNDKQIPVILIVDDVEVNARLLKKMVEKMGYQGLTATGVKEAVSQMQKELPQLILLDIMMGRLILSVNRLTMAKWQCGLIHI